tara:strand:- start:164 stop:400 length:237 start_codon:yes stop_codon:yes gene_type:complete
MDEAPNSKFEVKWDISVGDIVKIIKYDYDAYNVPVYGMVLKREETNQIYMFPSVEVLLFDTNEIRVCPAGTVEVISHA